MRTHPIRSIFKLVTTTTLLMLFAFGAEIRAQDNGPFGHRAPRCTAGTASGTYGYHMSGQVVGVGVFLVNGIFTQNPDGSSSGEVQTVLGEQQIPASFTGGTWTINDDCTGSGKFFAPALNLNVTYNFIATDGGEQIELLNTNAGIVLTGTARRISRAGKAPRCNNGTILGSYGHFGRGSLPGVAAVAGAGTATHTLDGNFNGILTGSDTLTLLGQYAPRINQGTYTVNSNCRGFGTYTDSLGGKINYTFTIVDGGDTIFFQGTDPGVAVQIFGKRLK